MVEGGGLDHPLPDVGVICHGCVEDEVVKLSVEEGKNEWEEEGEVGDVYLIERLVRVFES